MKKPKLHLYTEIVFFTVVMLFTISFTPVNALTSAVSTYDQKMTSSDLDMINLRSLASFEVVSSLEGDGIVKKYALIIGISDYKSISDLSYCDEDATDWFNYLAPLGYEITVLGDSHPENFPQWDGYATEANVRSVFSDILALADADDIVAFISSGHGGESRVGHGRDRYYIQFLCMWDCNSGEDGYDGFIYDSEFESIIGASESKTFVFLDHCFSGGIAFLQTNAYMTTTCTDDGYGYDDSAHQNGAWTYWFLEYTLIGQFDGTASMEETFAYAASIYPYDGGDTPMEFDGYSGFFYL